MKLFAKYNRINISATIIVFLAGSLTFYFLLRYILINQLDLSLESERIEIMDYLSIHHELPGIINTKGQYTTYAKATISYPISYFSVEKKIYDQKEWVREIQFGEKISDEFYLITVSKPLEETEDLLQIIIAVSICMIALILITTYLINRWIISRLWNPFYQSIDQVMEYSLSSQQSIGSVITDIDEFSLLNQSIRNMTERIQRDYQLLKDFTGSAAHEMQTPLSVIRTRFDLLIQNEIFIQNNPQYVTDIEKAVNKLSRLYQSLLLLTKVENRQFILNETINLKEIVDDKYMQMTELLTSKSIKVVLDTEVSTILFHYQLAEIIVNNLFNNAIKYNRKGGEIDIQLKDSVFMISNTSEIPKLDPDRVFQRFYRHTNSREDGNGLGLSIVKQICDLAHYRYEYTYKEGIHTFTIQFISKL